MIRVIGQPFGHVVWTVELVSHAVKVVHVGPVAFVPYVTVGLLWYDDASHAENAEQERSSWTPLAPKFDSY